MRWLLGLAAIGGAVALSRKVMSGLGSAPEPFSWYTDEQFMAELGRRAEDAVSDAIATDDSVPCDEARRRTLVAMDSLNEARRMSRHARWGAIAMKLSPGGITENIDVAIDLIQSSIKWYEKDCGAWTGPRP